MGAVINPETGKLDVIEKGATLGTVAGATAEQIVYGAASGGTLTSDAAFTRDIATGYVKVPALRVGTALPYGIRLSSTTLVLEANSADGVYIDASSHQIKFYANSGLSVQVDANGKVTHNYDGSNNATYEPTSTGGLIINTSNGKKIYHDKQSIADDATVNIDTGVSWGHGRVVAGGTEWAVFHCTTTSVTLESSSANVANSDSDGDLCIYMSGASLFIKNRLGGTSTISWDIITY